MPSLLPGTLSLVGCHFGDEYSQLSLALFQTHASSLIIVIFGFLAQSSSFGHSAAFPNLLRWHFDDQCSHIILASLVQAYVENLSKIGNKARLEKNILHFVTTAESKQLAYLLTNQPQIAFTLTEDVRCQSYTLMIRLHIKNSVTCYNNKFIVLSVPILHNNIWHW